MTWVATVGDELLDAARSANAASVYVLDMTPLGEKILAALVKIDTESGVASTRRNISLSRLEEADLGIPRLVEAIETGSPVQGTARVDNMTAQESRTLGKKQGELFWGFGIPVAIGLTDTPPVAYGLEIKLMYETPNFRADFGVGGMGSENLGMGTVSIQGNYLFSQNDISPFIGAGMGWFIQGGERWDEAENGIAFSVGAGMEFLRLYTTRLIVDFRVMLPTFELTAEPSGMQQATDEWVPIGLFGVTMVW